MFNTIKRFLSLGSLLSIVLFFHSGTRAMEQLDRSTDEFGRGPAEHISVSKNFGIPHGNKRHLHFEEKVSAEIDSKDQLFQQAFASRKLEPLEHFASLVLSKLDIEFKKELFLPLIRAIFEATLESESRGGYAVQDRWESSCERLRQKANEKVGADVSSIALDKLSKKYVETVSLPEPHKNDFNNLQRLLKARLSVELERCLDDESTFFSKTDEIMRLNSDSQDWIRFCFAICYEVFSKLNGSFSSFEFACLISKKGYSRFIVEELLEQNKQNLTRTDDTFTPLNAVAQAGSKSIAKILLNNGADLCYASESGDTPLMIAALNGHLSFVEWVLKKLKKKFKDRDALFLQELNRASLDGRTALYYAVEKGFENIASLLVRRGAKVSASFGEHAPLLYVAIGRCRYRLVKILLDAGVNVNEAFQGSTPLNSAIIQCGLAESSMEGFPTFSELQIYERRAICKTILEHPDLDSAGDLDALMQTAGYFGLHDLEIHNTKKLETSSSEGL